VVAPGDCYYGTLTFYLSMAGCYFVSSADQMRRLVARVLLLSAETARSEREKAAVSAGFGLAGGYRFAMTARSTPSDRPEAQ
jgi:hypothetical protein